MNKSYRSIWNESLGAWVAVSEIENAKGKPAGSREEGAARRGSGIGLKATLRMLPFMLLAIGSQAFAGNTNVYFNDNDDNSCVYINENGNSGNIAGKNSAANCSPANKANQTNQALFYNQDGKVGMTMSGPLHVTNGELGLGGAANNNGKFVIGSEATLGEKANNGVASIAIGASNVATKASGDDSLAIGNAAEGTAEQAIAIGRRAIASAENAIAAGVESNAKGTNSIAIGNVSRAGVNKAGQVQTGLNDVAIGNGSVAYGGSTVALGNDANTGGLSAIAIGDGAAARGERAIGVGNGARATGEYAMAFGVASESTASRTIAQGSTARATRDYAVAIGNAAAATNVKTIAVGADASAAGANASAFGAGANATHAEALAVGFQAHAGGYRATAIGRRARTGTVGDATALGDEANAEGGKSTALGSYAYAKGNQSVAVGSGNQAGTGANARGDQSIAIGGNVDANGNSSIAIGGDDLDKIATENAEATQKLNDLTGVEIQSGEYSNTEARGDAAVAVGVRTLATGHLSTAFGTFSESKGIASVALGVGAKALKDGSVALGAGSKTEEDAVYIQDATVQSLDEDGTVVGTVSYKGFAGGSENLSTGDQVSVGSVGFERQIKHVAPGNISKDSTDAINGSQLAIVIGRTQAQIQKAQDQLKGYVHVNEGNAHGTQADGDATTNLGNNRDKAGATGLYAVAAGVNAQAAGDASLAAGSDAKAMSGSAVALGDRAQALDNQAIAIGQQATANSDWDISIGRRAGLNVVNVASEGRNIAIGDGALREADAPNNNIVMGTDAAAESKGTFNVVIGTYANSPTGLSGVPADVKLTDRTKVSANNAVALGSRAIAYQDSSVSIGSRTLSLGRISNAIGASSEASGNYSIAQGYAAKATGTSSIAIGAAQNVNNKTQATAHYAVAIGSVDTQASGLSSLALGHGAQASASNAIAEGKSSRASMESNIAIGNGAQATTKTGALAIGKNSAASGGDSVALGTDSSSTHTGTVAVGKNASASLEDGAAIGSMSRTEVNKGVIGADPLSAAVDKSGNEWTATTAAVAVGDVAGGITRQITAVAAGTNDTDAVNVAQLKTVANHTKNLGDSLVDKLGGNAVINDQGQGTITMSNIGGTGEDSIDAAIKSVRESSAAGWNLSAQGENESNVAPKGKVDLSNTDNNIDISKPADSNNVTFNLAKNITVDQVNAGTGDNAVVIGNDGVQVGGATYINKDGLNANDKAVSNVAAGTQDEDAVNVSQLKEAVKALGGEAAVNADGSVKAPVYNIVKNDGNTEQVGNVGDALTLLNNEVKNPLSFVGDNDTETVTRKLGEQLAVKGGADQNNLSEGNIGVVGSAADNSLTVKLAKNINLGDTGSVQTGETKVDNNGVTITPADGSAPVSLTSDGLNNGDNVISGVAEGVSDTDAVNKAQLDKAAAKAANKVAAGKNIAVEEATNQDGSTTYTVKTKDEVEFNRVAVGDTVINKDSGDIVGLKNTALGKPEFANAGRAATEEQLNAAQDNLKTVLGGNAENTNGNITMSNIGDTGADNINDAIKSVRETANAGWNLTAQGKNSSNVAPNDTVDLKNTDGNIVISKTDQSNDVTFELADDITVNQVTAGTGDSAVVIGNDGVQVGGNTYIDKDGLNANDKVVKNVAVGKDDTDAVNVSQLKPLAKALGTQIDPTTGTVTDPSFVVTKADGSKYDGTPTIQGALDNIGTEIQKPITFAGDGGDADKFERTLGSQVNLKGGADKTKLSDNNIGVISDGQDTLDIKLSKELTNLTSADFVDAAGNSSKVSGDGITITPANGKPVSLTSNGLDNGGNVISGVAEGKKGTDAVNKDQLDAAAAKAANKVAAGKNIAVEEATNQDGSTTYTVKTKDEVEFNRVAVGDTVINKDSGDIVGLKNTALGKPEFANAGRAATEEQLNAAQDNLKTVLGGNAENTNGNITMSNIGDTGADNINDAIKSVRETANAGWNLTAQGKNSSNVAPNDTVDLNNQDGNIVISKEADSDNVTFDLAKEIDVDSLTAGDTTVNNDGVKVGDNTALTSDGLTVKDDAAGKTVKLTANGLDNGNNAITNVAVGKADTDAVNVSQLKPLAKALGTQIDPTTGTVTDPSFVVTKADGSKYDGTPTIQGALDNIGAEIQKPITFAGDGGDADKFERTLGSQVNLKGGADKTKLSDNNIGVISDGNDTLDIKLSKELTNLTSADFVDAAGNSSKVSGDGITITPANGKPVSLTSNGLDNGGNVISGVAEGVNDTDAVNKAQLDKAAAKAANKVAAGKNIAVEEATNQDGSTTYTVKTKDEVEFNRVAVGDTVIDKDSGDIVGLKNTGLGGDTFAKNKRAATEEQLNTAQDNLKTVLGGNAENTNGNITMSNIGDTGADNINDAIKSVRETANTGWNLTAQGKNSSNVAPNDTVDLNNQDGNIVISKEADSDNVTFDLAKEIDVDSLTAGDTTVNNDGVKVGDNTALTSDGLTVKDDAAGKTVKLTANGLDNGNNAITNVASGKNNTDAVNVSQLKPMVQALGMNVDPNNGTVSAPSFVVSKVDGTSYDGVNTVQAALNHIGTEVRRPIHFTGNIGNVSRKGDETLNIQGGLSDSAAASDKNIRTKIDGETMSIELAEAPRFGNVTINDNGKISGLEAATVAAGSKEAVNGSQLYKQGKGVESIIGGQTAYNPDNGTYTNADIGGTGEDNVNDAIAAVRDSATAGWNLTAQGQNESNVAPNDTVDLNNADGNIVITKKADSDDVTFDLAKAVKVDSLTAGDTTVNNDGVKVGDNTALTSDGLTIKDAASGQTVSLTDKGLNNGGKVISGVANGLVEKGSQEAVNGDQLFAVDQKAAANTDALNRGLDFAGNSGNFNRKLGERVTVKGGLDNTAAASDDNIRTVADSTGNIQVLLADAPTFKGKLTAQGLDAGGQKITGVKDGEDAGDAVNIAQLQRALENQAITQQLLVHANSPFSYVNSKGELLARQVDNQGNEHFVKVEDGSEYTEKDITISALNPVDPQTAVPTVVGNIADGKNANDAVNVSQLKNVVKSLGGGAEVNPDGSIKDPVYNITKNNGGNETVNNIGDALGLLNDEINKPLVFVGDNNDVKVERKLDTELAVKGGATGTLTDNNIGVAGNADDNSLEVKLAENINLGSNGSVTTGQTVLNNDGVKVGDNVALTSDGLKAGDVNITYAGIDAGNKKITGVKAGENATDAVNKAQLDAVQAAASNKVTVGKNLTAKEVKNADGSLTYNVATADDVAFDSVTAGQGDNQVLLDNKGVNVGGNTYLSDKGVNANNKKVVNVAKGDIAEDSTDAVNGSQLYQTADSVTKLLGGNAKLSPDGSVNMTDIGGTGANNINDAIQSLNRTVAGTKETVSAGDNIVVEKTVKAGGATDYVVSTAKDLNVDSVTAGNTVVNDNGLSIANGPSVTVNGLDAGDKKVTNVANGEISATSKDAVNGSQLYQAYQVLGGSNTSINTKDAPAGNGPNGTTPAGTVTTVVTNPDGSQTTTTETNQKVAVSTDKGGNEYTLTTYNVEGQNTYVTNDVIQAIGKMNEQGIKFFHTNDGEVKPVVQGNNQEDSSASGAYATAIGYQTSASGKGSLALGNTYTVVDQNGNVVQDSNGQAQTQRTQAIGVNAVAIGSGAQANETNTIAIGTGNIVNGKNSGAIGDPSIINGENTYSVGNNNKVNSSNTFVLGNNVTQTMDNSVVLGDQSAATEIHTTAKGGNYTYAGVNDANVAGVQDVKGVVSVGSEGQTRQVQNVAAGVVSQNSTDAINGSQLYHTNAAINAVGNHVVNMGNQLNQKIEDVETRANAGTASAMAVAGLPQAYLPGKSMMAISGSSYRGQSAYAVGYSSISDNGNWVIKGTATGNSRGHYGATAGVGYQW
ncbi:YadA-like family protein [Neisseria montereyensis]|uniref:YadA-like family protein n=1 Tax=Neisseria montereyensis TaxID=2973938 RepID=A0ABT2FFM7_9NEIS|nr:YadA-like family protein [Neisseria montereyensis]MCS4534710.1 YadA-like family protein [Neisseria montereyensis]